MDETSDGESANSDVSEPDANADTHNNTASITKLMITDGSNPL